MTPKEKAQELVNDFFTMFYDDSGMGWGIECSKKCALVVVDEILKSEPRNPSNVDWDEAGGSHQYYYEFQREDANKFWKEVKQEIEKL